jgi:hypothetical protein
MVGEPHKFGKAADNHRNVRRGLSSEAIETLSDAFGDMGMANPPPTPDRRPRGRPAKNK